MPVSFVFKIRSVSISMINTSTPGSGFPTDSFFCKWGGFTATTGEHSVMPYPSSNLACGATLFASLKTFGGHFSAPDMINLNLSSVVFDAFSSMCDRKVGVPMRSVTS